MEVIFQMPIHNSPSAPVTRNDDRQPYHGEARLVSSGAATIPSVTPTDPTAFARPHSDGGRYRADAFPRHGRAAASPTPSAIRDKTSPRKLCVSPVDALAADQIKTAPVTV